MSEEMLQRLVAVSRRWGEDPARVQGAGGNVSVKDDARVWIKASGRRLREVAVASGIAEVDRQRGLATLPPSRMGLPTPAEERAYAAAVTDCRVNQAQPRPSMELGCHLATDHTWVVHDHSLAAIVVGLLPAERQEPFLRPIRDAGCAVLQVPAAIPGLQLAWEMRRRLPAVREYDAAFWLLENHGAVWTANNLEKLERVADAFERHARVALGTALAVPVWATTALGENLHLADGPEWSLPTEPLFPDYAVFFPNSCERPQLRGQVVQLPRLSTPAQRQVALELVYAQAVVATRARALGCLRPFPAPLADIVTHLGAEAWRRAALAESSPCA
jgi:ribulose-5-phosphate 4-epimerase/fuculose-1-phosphate aldolase